MPILKDNWFVTAVDNPLYICQKSGDDLDVGDREFPKQTLNGTIFDTGLPKDNGIRSGLYLLTASLGFLGISFVGDSENVTIDGQGLYSIGFSTAPANGELRFFNCTVKNVVNIHGRAFGGIANGTTWYNCTVEDCTLVEYGRDIVTGEITQKTVFKDVVTVTHKAQQANNTGAEFERLTFDNITTYDFQSSVDRLYTQCWFGGGDFLSENTGTGTVTFKDCALLKDTMLFDGSLLQLFGDAGNIQAEYTDGQKFSGTYTTPINSSVIIFTDCFWTADPGFITDTHILTPASKLVNGGVFIGRYNAGSVFDANHIAFDPANNAIYNGIDRNTPAGTLTQTVPGVTGDFQTSDNPATALKLDTNITMTDAIRFFGTFLQPTEVIDKAVFNDPANLEVRRTFELWAYNYVLEEWIDTLEIEAGNIYGVETDSLGVGNGDVSVDVTTLAPLSGYDTFMIKGWLRTDGV